MRLQSMTNTSTTDTKASVEQCIRILEEGGELVRLTTPGTKDARNLENIKAELLKAGYQQPIVADVHFNPKVAEIAAEHADKVRINPGNYADRQKNNNQLTNEAYLQALEAIHQKLLPLINICKKNNRALRIGVNHGSLSERVVNRYGDTLEGMAESAMEFLRVCKREGFHQLVISMKSSNTRVMVHSTRLLVKMMEQEGMHYPLHLGVTEAGAGEDGRIKSAVGIGTLLADGIGDTIRVSLTEDPAKEIPVARKLVDHFKDRANHVELPEIEFPLFNPFEYQENLSRAISNIGGEQVPVVVINEACSPGDLEPDFLAQGLFKQFKCLEATVSDIQEKIGSIDDKTLLILESKRKNPVGEFRYLLAELRSRGILQPVIFRKKYTDHILEDLQIKASADFGPLFLDGLGDGIWIDYQGKLDDGDILSCSFGILQASRVRTTKTEYISCPTCGRTNFNIEQVLKDVKAQTSHLKNLKIAVMGCIVNGPGEMVDADFGYVGAGPGKVSLYKGKQVIKRNIPQEDAIGELVRIITDNPVS